MPHFIISDVLYVCMFVCLCVCVYVGRYVSWHITISRYQESFGAGSVEYDKGASVYNGSETTSAKLKGEIDDLGISLQVYNSPCQTCFSCCKLTAKSNYTPTVIIQCFEMTDQS